MPAPALLGKDAAYWQSVHQAGQGLLKERQEAAKKEKDAWQAKVLWPANHMPPFGFESCLCHGIRCACKSRSHSASNIGTLQRAYLLF